MFEVFAAAFNIALYQPLFNVLIWTYNNLPFRDFGLAVIVLTLAIKFLFYPLGTKSIKSQKAMQDLQPRIKAIQERFKQDKARQAKETMDLYKSAGVNPFSGCLPLLIQLPILIALYRVFWKGIGPDAVGNYLYPFIAAPESINYAFLGLIDLSKPFWPLAIVTGFFQYLQTRFSSADKQQTKDKGDFSNILQNQMLYFFPMFTVLILLRLPSALALYWLTTTIFTIFQQRVIYKRQNQDVHPRPT